MTVEIDQATLLRAQTAPAAMNGHPQVPIGTPSIMSSTTTLVSNHSGIISPTTSLMSTPVGNDSLINKKADPAQGLYQTCVALRERLMLVPDFEQFLEPLPGALEDPVSQLWRCFRMGSSLCVLFNAMRPVSLIEDSRCQLNLGSANDCKAATYHFLQGIKKELNIPDSESFMIHNLYSDDTNGFVKVTRTVSRILDELKKRNLLLNKKPSDTNRSSSERKPLDNRARVVQELVDTERKYVQDLETLQDYMRTLEADEVISKDLIHVLFLNLNQLVDFQRRFLIKVETQNDLLPEQQSWGALFVEYETFAVYQPYASNFKNAQDLAIEERAKLEKKPHPVYDQLNAFLIKPIQRVTKYPLLLRDLIKQTDPLEAEDQNLHQGLEAIENINRKINEAIRKSENAEVVKDLEGRVEDWKGHKLEHFGELLLHGQFSVIKGDPKGDVEREYYIYLFERILLCCKEVGKDKKQNRAIGVGRPRQGKKRTMLQLKGRIFMQNVTDVISLAKGGSYTLQIFWKGDPGVENFVIRHPNEERLAQWNSMLQKQREVFTRAGTPGSRNGGRTGAGMRATATTEFAWMANSDATDQDRRSEDERSEDEEDVDDSHDTATLIGTPSSGFNMSRNGSSTSLRSRAATNENLIQPPAPMGNLPGTYARPPPRYPQTSVPHQPPLTLNTGVSPISQSPERNASYFSPVTETPLTSRTSSSSQFPFPRQTSTGYYEEPHRYGTPTMSRSTSREGAAIAASQAAQAQFAHHQASQRLQRPSLPGMAPSASATATLQQNRMRSASSPNIHHVPSQAQLARSPNGMIPPMPSVPSSYVAYSGGPAVINRSQNNSPTSPNLSMQGAPARNGSPAVQDGHHSKHNGNVANGSSKSHSQVKLKVNFGNDKFVIIVPYNIPYVQLMDRIERKVKLCGSGPEIASATNLKIRYRDEDGDYISMISNDDVLMAFDAPGEPGQNDNTGISGVVTLYVSV
ncbi:unnamed protein product [Tuber melanosporum]|uniref:(Perigord truffle) hypothetical protein n=1 Tax=Tuber melanosporum (strain Mel28) TaxID=656061 RepID=D5GGD7_TUBMM|nr:uncharacterized protein GSTUM_00007328001 [Tuber melanosporum]CAZ83580.1 unnamed protein product [Tuber melanosporum]